jgi:predicted dehydrogenase
MASTLSVGVIGIGFGQQAHVPAFRADPRCCVRAVCASTPERARQAGERLGVPDCYGDWRELVESPGLDVVSLAVPPSLQAEIAVAAARAGKHLFCEKPAAANATGAAAMLGAAEAAGVCHAVDFLFPELPAFRQTRDLLRAESLGPLRSAHLSWRTEIYAIRHRKVSWKLCAGDGGGALNSFASHSLYYLEWLFGPVARLSGRLGPTAARGEVRVDAWLEFASGLPLSLSVATDAPHGSGHRLEVYGDAGALVLETTGRDHGSGWRLLLGGRADESPRPLPLPDEPAGADGRVAPVASLVRRFVDAIHGQGEMTPSLRDGLRVQRLIDRLRDADHTGRSLAA